MYQLGSRMGVLLNIDLIPESQCQKGGVELHYVQFYRFH